MKEEKKEGLNVDMTETNDGCIVITEE